MQDPILGDDSAPKLLHFDGVLVIVGGGALDEHLLHRLAADGAHLVGADGGGDAIRAAGLVPEAIIGDLDSLADPAGWDARTRLLHIAEQDTTDFEKVLYSTTAPLTIALGMTGRRFDHTLAALDAMARHAHGRAIILVDEEDIALGLNHPFDFDIETGARVSIHPLAPVRCRQSQGLKYPLDDITLAPGLRPGTSNAADAEHVAIEPVDGGVWLLILEKRWLWPLMARLQT